MYKLIAIYLCLTVIYFPYILPAQTCATKLNENYKKVVSESFENFYSRRCLLKTKQNVNSLQSIQSDLIKIRRVFVKSSTTVVDNSIHTESDWQGQLSIANVAFSGANIQFEFLPVVDTIVSNSYYFFQEEFDRGLFDHDDPDAINVYLCGKVENNNLGLSGTPYYGSLAPLGIDDRPGNAIVLANYGIGPSYSSNLTHELGHFFGLLHTFESAYGKENVNDGSNQCSVTGDLICDTEASRESFNSTSECIITDLKTDCNGALIIPDVNNFMSYFNNSCLTKFTTMQLEKIKEIKEKYRGYLYKPAWAKININSQYILNSAVYTSNFCVLPAVFYLKSYGYNVLSYHWSVIGSNAVIENPDSQNTSVSFSEYGSHTVKLLVTDLQGNIIDCGEEVILVNDRQSETNGLPIGQDFENGLPPFNPNGWIIYNTFRDCYTFELANTGSTNSFKSVKKSSFNQENVNDDFDYLYTPIFSLQDLSKCFLNFDYAYASKFDPGDTLRIFYVDCGISTLIWKKGGADLQTVNYLIPQAQFVPRADQWISAILDVSEVISIIENKATRFIFSLQTKNGNAIYIDNISITGEYMPTSNTLSADYTRPDHKVTLHWSDFSGDETGYEIFRAETGVIGPWILQGIVAADVTTWSQLAEKPSVTYYYRVSAIGSSVTRPSNIAYAVINDLPEKPIPLSVSVSSRKAILNWLDNNEYETSYELYYSYDKNAPMSLLESLPSGTVHYEHAGLPRNSKIYYMVRAKEMNFISKPTDTVEAIIAPSVISKTIERVEAYIGDIDPGFGNGILLAGPYTSYNPVSVSTLPVDGLNDGLQIIHIRAKDNTGQWSQLHTSAFLKITNPAAGSLISKMEYYLDTDPGIGQATAITIPPAADHVLLEDFTLPVNLLVDGVHFLYIRLQDNKGYWSNVFQKSFLKLTGPDGNKKIIEVAYSLDNGLLLGTGTPVAITSGVKLNLSFTLPPLSNGKHYVSIRAKDDGNNYSNVSMDSFFVNDESFCTYNSVVYYSSTIGTASSYIWQQNDGTGWSGIINNGLYSGARSKILRLDNPPSSWYGYKFRCIVDGVADQDFVLKFSNTWTGAKNDDWFDDENWSCHKAPDQFTDVLIDASSIVPPVLNTNGTCRSMRLKPGATLIISPGVLLDITGQ